MEDWRLPKEEEKLLIDRYSGMEFLQIVFPEFWQQSYKTKNNFYKYLYESAKEDVKEFGYEEYLNDDRISKFWHMHCIFCMKTITTDMHEECYRSVEDDLIWVCTECFNDFKYHFEWTACENVQDIPTEGFTALGVIVANTKDKT